MIDNEIHSLTDGALLFVERFLGSRSGDSLYIYEDLVAERERRGLDEPEYP